MVLWARRTCNLLELPNIEHLLEESQNESPIVQEKVDYFAKIKTNTEEELKIVTAKFDEYFQLHAEKKAEYYSNEEKK